ncbi:hypothetical protein [Bacillus sp. OxB-1]|nr:hypothetical protein [Bacillus sp. OxB-1]
MIGSVPRVGGHSRQKDWHDREHDDTGSHPDYAQNARQDDAA